MSLLTPDSGLLFWMIVSFGIVFVILSKYGFPVIIKANGLVNTPKNSTKGMIGNGSFR